jgi:4a-hydroxytetrahydrobiopterin dehydratase
VPDWILADGHLSRTFAFEDSSQSIAFINDVLTLSVQEGHIPDISFSKGKFVEVGYYTYQAGGLTLNDFIMAAKINEQGYTE